MAPTHERRLLSRHRFLLLVPLLASCQEPPPEGRVPPLDPGPWELVFHSERSGEGDLYRWSPEAPAPRILVTGPGAQYAPRWDRARRRLTYLADEPGGAALFAVEEGGTVSLGPNPGTEESVVWSPDGLWRLFSAREAESFDLFLQPADGSAPPTRLTDARGNDRQPAWSPDGTRIAFTSDRDGSDDIWVMPARGGAPRNVTATPGAYEGHPAWSPDGARLVYDGGETGSRDADVWIQPVDGGPRRRLAGGPGPDLVPSWSPDDTWIAFGSVTGGDWEVWVVRPDGSGARAVTRSEGFDGDPLWIPASWAVPGPP